MILGSRKPMIVKLQNYMPIPFCGCHIWMGSTNADGYGTIRQADGWHLRAHREAYREYVGDPGGMDVLHTCDIPPLRGEINPSAKLTQADVDKIRSLY